MSTPTRLVYVYKDSMCNTLTRAPVSNALYISHVHATRTYEHARLWSCRHLRRLKRLDGWPPAAELVIVVGLRRIIFLVSSLALSLSLSFSISLTTGCKINDTGQASSGEP